MVPVEFGAVVCSRVQYSAMTRHGGPVGWGVVCWCATTPRHPVRVSLPRGASAQPSPTS